jgi:hypothetical protein
MSGNSAIQGSTAKNASEISAIAIDFGFAEIWPGQGVVNGAKVSGNSSFCQTFRVAKAWRLGECPAAPNKPPIKPYKDFP